MIQYNAIYKMQYNVYMYIYIYIYVYRLSRFRVIVCLGANGAVKEDVNVLELAHAVDATLQIKWSVAWG